MLYGLWLITHSMNTVCDYFVIVFLISRVWVRIPSRDTCVLLRPSDRTLSRWSSVLCNACKITQCTYRKEKGFAPVFLVRSTANCATSSCKVLYMVLSELGFVIQTIVPHLAGNTVCYSARSVKYFIIIMSI